MAFEYLLRIYNIMLSEKYESGYLVVLRMLNKDNHNSCFMFSEVNIILGKRDKTIYY